MKQRIAIIGILIVMLTLLLAPLTNKTYAADQSYYLGLTNVRAAQNGGAYEIGAKSGSGTKKKVWKVVSYPSQDSTTINYDNAFYCLRAELGFGLTEGNQNVTTIKKHFTIKRDMKTETDKSDVIKRLQEIKSIPSEDNTTYNKILWILDNMYLPKAEGAQAFKENLLRKAEVLFEEDELGDEYITDDDIEVVQQLVLWYFTNSENETYHNTTLPTLYFKLLKIYIM